MSTISGLVTNGVTLGTVTGGGTYASPLTVTQTGYIDPASGNGIFGPSTGAWTVVNYGRIFGTSAAVDLSDGGSVTNAPGGSIKAGAGSFGIRISGSSGTVTNAGYIGGDVSAGIILEAGGLVINQSGGTIAATVVGWGAYLEGASCTLTNAGTITGGLEGVRLYQGGGIFNQSGGLIRGFNDGIFVRRAAAYVYNAGTITGTNTGAVGMVLTYGGTVVNAASGKITPGLLVAPFGSGTVTGTGTVINAGTIGGAGSGIYLSGGGEITNSGLIAGGVTIVGGGAVIDTGTIGGSTAVRFSGTGSNRLVLGPGYAFGGTAIGSTTAGVTNTLELAPGMSAGTLLSFNSEFLNFTNVKVDAGAQWTLAGNNSIGHATLINAGTLHLTGNLVFGSATMTNSGLVSGKVVLASGGYLDNLSGGSMTSANGAIVVSGGASLSNAGTIGAGISMYGGDITNLSGGRIVGVAYGIIVRNTPATITNAGTIAGVDGFGMDLIAGGRVVNQSGGFISGAVAFDPAINAVNGAAYIGNAGRISGNGGIILQAGGTIVNHSGGSIYSSAALAIAANRMPITVSNGGVISGGGYGVYTLAGGLVTNQPGGTIVGTATGIRAGVGIVIKNGGTVVDAGTIVGAGGTAVSLAGPGADLLVLDPGYVLNGKAIAQGTPSTLELGSAASAGTVSGLGTKFLGFGTITVDAGANWVMSGVNTIGAGVTLTAAAGLTIGGVLYDAGRLTAAPTETVSASTIIFGGGSAEFQGPVGNGATIAFREAGGALQIDDLARANGTSQLPDFTAPIGGLRDGDRIRIASAGLGNFTGIDAASAGAFNGTATPLSLTSGGQTVASLILDGDYTGDAFGVSVPEGGYQTVGMQINSPADFNGDGTGDVLFQSAGNGELFFAAMTNGTLAGWGAATGGLGTLSAVGHGDVNGDGISDVIMQDANSGRVYFGLQDGSGLAGWAFGPNVPGFTVVGVGDIQGDDRADIVLQDAAGNIDYYDTKAGRLYDGEHGGFVASTPGWNVVGVGDVNGDGFADIVIQSAGGQIEYLNMAGGVFSGFVGVTSTPGYAVKAVADLTGDGFADIVVQNPSAAADALYADMHGGVFSGWGVATTGLTPDYVVADTADVFNNGHADLIVQQQSTGNTYYAEEGASGFQQWGNVASALGSNYRVA